jgi:hypothetical protein
VDQSPAATAYSPGGYSALDGQSSVLSKGTGHLMDPTSLVIAILVVTMLFMAGMVRLGHLDIVQAIARMDRSATAAIAT